ncbi:glucose 1-dehydrogenase [Novosphingobium sp. KCTC 2891]|uniref:SDR family NAD(P)-dependent oxidoreductase n=1 Tax=Novosphingobium sp. KCTC 2891 TaxID=2989730 RepID=UPI0022218D46|nr:glucose 1-dehydrogenase [Novosphingobium sp. KCTC 2891]MCW1383607.1 glucose 1-dehydrogenase [Novosphingobium sp. KCTC 2891]
MPIRPTTELFGLAGQSAIVTAAGQGLGRQIALRLANAGAAVIVTHRRIDGARQVADEIIAAGGKALALELDVSHVHQAAATVAAAREWAGSLHALVNCAGGMHPFTPFLEVAEQTFDDTLARNFKGAYFLSQAFARALVADERSGRIVNIASTAAFKPDFQLAAYNASKAALISFTHSVAVELAPHRILVNAVVPGPVRTTNTEWIYDDPTWQAALAKAIPLGAPADPDDVAAAVLFMVSAASGHVTGSTLTVDGGFMWK